ncbi:MAG: hypothetical protein ACKPFK_24880, partial [Dolichospermum sp.]
RRRNVNRIIRSFGRKVASYKKLGCQVAYSLIEFNQGQFIENFQSFHSNLSISYRLLHPKQPVKYREQNHYGDFATSPLSFRYSQQ